MHALTIDQKAARLHAEWPYAAHREVMQSLARRRKRRNYGKVKVCDMDLPRYAWQDRADLQ